MDDRTGSVVTARIRAEHRPRDTTVRDSLATMSNEDQLDSVCDAVGTQSGSMRLTDVDEMRRDHVESGLVANASKWQDLITPAEQASIELRYRTRIDRQTGEVER